MTYRLIDAETADAVGEYASERAALRDIADAVVRYGRLAPEVMSLTLIRDDLPPERGFVATGEDLVALALAVGPSRKARRRLTSGSATAPPVPSPVAGTRVRMRTPDPRSDFDGEPGLIVRTAERPGAYIVRPDRPVAFAPPEWSTGDEWEILVPAAAIEVLEVPLRSLSREELTLESIGRVQQSALHISHWSKTRDRGGTRSVAVFFDDDRPDVRDLARVHNVEGPGQTLNQWTFHMLGSNPVRIAVANVWMNLLNPVRCRFHLAFDFARHRDPLYGLAITGRLIVAPWNEAMGTRTLQYAVTWPLDTAVMAQIRAYLEATAAVFDTPASIDKRARYWATVTQDDEVLAVR